LGRFGGLRGAKSVADDFNRGSGRGFNGEDAFA